MNVQAKIACREHCGHEPFQNPKAENMHYHRVHSGKIIAFRQKRNGHLKIDRRTKAWRLAHPRLAKPLGGRGKPRRDVVMRAMAHFAQPSVKLECPNCRYDFTLLTSSKVPNKVCPGCGTPLKTFIDRMMSVVKA